MIKLIVKLAIVALVVNGTWRVGSVYLRHYRFVDAVTQTAQFGGSKSESQLRARVIELAGQYDIPLAEDGFTLRRDGDHTITQGSYTEPIELFPTYIHPWPFTWTIDMPTVRPAQMDLLPPATP